MPQLDKLLAHIAPRGGVALRLEPNQQPMLHLANGGDLALLANPLPSTMLDLLAREVLPSGLAEAWNTSGEASFDHAAGGESFRITFSRSPQGIHICADLRSDDRPGSPVAAVPAAHAAQAPVAAAPVPARIPVPAAHAAPDPAPVPPRIPAPAPAAAPPPTGADPSHPLAEALFTELLARQGSDLHCSAFEAPIARVHGDLVDLDAFGILGPNQLLELMEAIAPPRIWAEYQARHDADFAHAFDCGGCRLRVNYFVDRAGPGFVARVIPNAIPDAEQLGLELPVRRLAMLAKGLVLVTGPTGSGKSTTLAALIDLANRQRTDHILTIEDPVEFVHPRKRCLVNQREVGTHTESFKTGLRAGLREDPDIVMVGEMRDLETIEIALETAATGHLVFGTLHTSSAVGTIDRIVDQFPADRQQQIRVMLAEALKCVVSQILLKRVTGGRIAALETLFITPAISNLIRESKNFQIPSAMQTGRAYGQKLMNDTLIERVQDGQVAVLEAYHKAPDKESFMAALKRAEIPWDPRNEDAFS
jgi:twitching motility protein PilT